MTPSERLILAIFREELWHHRRAPTAHKNPNGVWIQGDGDAARDAYLSAAQRTGARVSRVKQIVRAGRGC